MVDEDAQESQKCTDIGECPKVAYAFLECHMGFKYVKNYSMRWAKNYFHYIFMSECC